MAEEVTYTHREGQLRLYDGHTPTPFYIEIPFLQAGLKGAAGRPRPTQTARLNRGRIDRYAHYIEGADDPILGSVPITFSFMLGNFEPNLTKLKQALNTDFAAAWTVGSNTWISTKGTTQVLSGGSNPAMWTTPGFTNSPRNRCVNIETVFSDPVTGGTNHTGYKWAECYLPPDQQSIDEAEEMVTLSVNGQCYGAITGITSFTAGTAG